MKIRDFVITISKPTAMPGEVTTVAQAVRNGDLHRSMSTIGKAIDWRIRTENERVLARTRKRLKQLGLKIPGF